MSSVILICEKSFSKADREIVDGFMEFLQASINNDSDRLNEMVMDVDEFINVTGRYQSKDEFISQIGDGTLQYSKFDILEPTVLFDDDDSASMIAKVRFSVEINGKDLRVISDSVASFERMDGKWRISRWDC